MISTLSTVQHYVGAFINAVRSNGWRHATFRAAGFLRGRMMPRLRHELHRFRPEPVSPLHEIIGQLKPARTNRTLLLIVSDIQIKQCVHYRIDQKIRLLEEIGIQAMQVSPADTGRLRAFAGLAHTVIVYRTALDKELIQDLRDSGAQLLFEFDDLVVGRDALEASGILTQLSDHQSRQLRILAENLRVTAQACDAIIVSTPFLADLYGRPENGLADKPSFVVPNFVETDRFSPPGNKTFTFAYTSPSGSIESELEMLKGFLAGYDSVADRDWTILVMGNASAQKALGGVSFQRGRVIGKPFSAFEDYLQNVAAAETVLIPLSDSTFNRAKTVIRLMDSAISGTQTLFCPVGAYQGIQAALDDDSVCIPSGAWAEAGTGIAAILAQQDRNVADLQKAVRELYGREAARACYRNVFVEGLGVRPVPATADADAP